MNAQDLIDFENEIKNLFNEGKILSPIHLSAGNEQQLIEIFKGIKPNDYVLATHRSHYAALLHGIPPEWLKQEIIAGHSMHLASKEHRFFSSAIVGGICPIAVGIAMGIKRNGEKDKVFCFVGDMGSRMGIFYESVRYSEGHDLPILFIVENNHKSVCTPTAEVWGIENKADKIRYYEYEMGVPHSGFGGMKWLKF